MAGASWLGGIGSALGHRDYRLYLLGAWASFVGISIYHLALGWYVWELTASSAWLMNVVLCEVVTIVALVPFTGAAADRFGAHRILGTSQISGAAVMAALALLAALDAMTIELLLALVVLNGVNMALMQPAYCALVANLVPRKDLAPAIALQALIVPTAGGIGIALAGGLLVWQGVAAGFAVNAVFYLAMVAALLAISYRDPERAAGPSGGLFGEVAQGLRYMVGQETIRTLLLMTVTFSIVLQPVVELPPDLASDPFGRGADGRNILLLAAGAGALVGLLWLARRGKTRGLTRLFGATGVACGIALAGFASTDAFWLGVALMAVCGLLVSANWAIGLILIQNCVDPAMRARVMSLVVLTLRAVPAASAALLGWLAALFGLAPPIVVAACLGALVGLWALNLIRTARLDERAEGPPAG